MIFSQVKALSKDDIKSIMRNAAYSWIEAEFQLMVSDGALFRSRGDHGDEDLYSVAPGVS